MLRGQEYRYQYERNTKEPDIPENETDEQRAQREVREAFKGTIIGLVPGLQERITKEYRNLALNIDLLAQLVLWGGMGMAVAFGLASLDRKQLTDSTIQQHQELEKKQEEVKNP